MTANGNSFLDFKEVELCASSSGRKVLAVMAKVPEDRINEFKKDNHSTDELVEETIRLLKKKYGIEPFEDSKLVEINDDGDYAQVYLLPFYDSKKRMIIATIKLISCGEGIFLIARDEELYRDLYQRIEETKLDAL